EDRIVLVESDAHRVPPQHQVRDPVKRSAPNAMNVLAAGQSLDPPQHFPRRAVRKSLQQNPLRRYALLDQISNTVSDRPRLPRPRTRNDERRLRRRSNDAKLLFVQLALVPCQ